MCFAWLALTSGLAWADIVPPSPPDRGELAGDLPPPPGPTPSIPVWVLPLAVAALGVGSLGGGVISRRMRSGTR